MMSPALHAMAGALAQPVLAALDGTVGRLYRSDAFPAGVAGAKANACNARGKAKTE